VDCAEKGSASAQGDLGLRYLKGDGLEQNEDLGRSWLEKAAKQGNNLACQTLKNTDYLTEKRDEGGRVLRSKSARRDFMSLSGHSNGRANFIIYLCGACGGRWCGFTRKYEIGEDGKGES
jgi:TPR repeat protein